MYVYMGVCLCSKENRAWINPEIKKKQNNLSLYNKMNDLPFSYFRIPHLNNNVPYKYFLAFEAELLHAVRNVSEIIKYLPVSLKCPNQVLELTFLCKY